MNRLDRRIVARLLELVNRWRPAVPPEDPHTAVREPKRQKPGGRSPGVGVPEPGDEISVSATAHDRI